jgi:hypothetical protein
VGSSYPPSSTRGTQHTASSGKGGNGHDVLEARINPGEIAHVVNITEHELANLGNSKNIGEL